MRRLRGTTLRGRLLAALLALLALICLIVGVVTELALRQNLIAQVDDKLSGPSHGIVAGQRPGDRSNQQFDPARAVDLPQEASSPTRSASPTWTRSPTTCCSSVS